MSIKKVFQSWTDMQTRPDYMTMITVYAGGSNAYERCQSLFSSYKYYKLGRVTIKMIPVSTLPVNPVEVAKNTPGKLDPRDLMTPGCVRITNGEDFYYDIFSKTSTDDDKIAHREIYNTMIMDTRWFKWNLQKGLVKSAYPKYWVIGQTRQDYYPGSIINVPTGDNYVTSFKDTGTLEFGIDGEAKAWTRRPGFSSDRGIIQTGQSGRMGWLPTDAIIETGLGEGSKGSADGQTSRTAALNNIPQIELFRVILPPAYQTTFYYRMFITETIYFKEAVIDPPTFMTAQRTFVKYSPLDRFIRPRGATAMMPDEQLNFVWPGYPLTPNSEEDEHEKQAHVPPEE